MQDVVYSSAATSPTKKLLAHPSAVARHLQRRRSTAAQAPVLMAPTTTMGRHSIALDGRYPEPTMRDSYDIVWDHTFLGLVFRCNSKNQCIIRRVDPNAPPVVLQLAHVGDALVAYNDEPNLNYDKIMERLRNPRFPVTLSFSPPSMALPVSRPPAHHRHSFEMPRPVPMEAPRTSAPSMIQSDVSGSVLSSEDNDAVYTTYNVTWNEGTKLGVSIIKVGAHPSVKERTERPADPSLAQIQPGDQLVSIQGVSTLDIGYPASIVLLRDTRKPVNLVFRRLASRTDMRDSVLSQPGPPVRETEYSLVWESGPLGLTLKKDKVRNELMVAKLQDEGLAARSKLLSLGDVLVSIAHVQVADLGLRGTMAYLKAVPKPAVLVFHRVTGTDPDAVSISSHSSRASSVVENAAPAVALPISQPTPAIAVPFSPPAPVAAVPMTPPRPMSPPPAYDFVMQKRSSVVAEDMAKLNISDDTVLSSEGQDEVGPLSAAPKSRLEPAAPVSTHSTYSDLDDSGLVMGHDMPPITTLPGPGIVNIVWSGGPLGVTLKATGARVTISRVTGKGEARGLDMLRAGDILSAVNEVEELTLESATYLLKTLEKPVFLRFTLQQVEEEL
ncbi:hypothetical protein ACHHYP_14166 [Achlya hypogyna]|uniref:PDZ domain-containing protein n=1 Tax=Achlya hypogyna TaxID=1202772 RepID=A0A1V9YDW8_ACHHY|nr:hypothetical protein ACHHYP_14166 [Achlya hypogyna]